MAILKNWISDSAGLEAINFDKVVSVRKEVSSEGVVLELVFDNGTREEFEDKGFIEKVLKYLEGREFR